MQRGPREPNRDELEEVIILVTFAGWTAQQQSARCPERIRAGLSRRKAEGKPFGRQPGTFDVKPRKRSRYHARWERERAAMQR